MSVSGRAFPEMCICKRFFERLPEPTEHAVKPESGAAALVPARGWGLLSGRRLGLALASGTSSGRLLSGEPARKDEGASPC